jgi:hypothetical protein
VVPVRRAATPSSRERRAAFPGVRRTDRGVFLLGLRGINGDHDARGSHGRPVPAGRLTFTLPDEQRLIAGTPGTWRQNGRTVSVQIGDLPAGRNA